MTARRDKQASRLSHTRTRLTAAWYTLIHCAQHCQVRLGCCPSLQYPPERLPLCSLPSSVLCQHPTSSLRSPMSSDNVLPIATLAQVPTSQVPTLGLRACLSSFDTVEPGRPHRSGTTRGQHRRQETCLRPLTQPQHSRKAYFRCSITPPTRTATDASLASSRMPAHGSRWRWWLAFSSYRTFTGYPTPVSLAHAKNTLAASSPGQCAPP